ncbi:MAG: hypothetical protein HC819_14105 [Cyclobacteriaceae bacterium]|nr:hypothetical protein [Cyclobacteriaceae bacterium]
MNKLKFQLVYVVSLLILVSIAYLVYLSYKNFQKYSIWINHSENVRAEIENLNRVPIELSREIIRAALTGDQLDTMAVQRIKNSIPGIYHKLDSLVADDKPQMEKLEEIRVVLADYIHEANVLMQLMLRTDKITRPIINQVRGQEKLVDEINEKMNAMKHDENTLLKTGWPKDKNRSYGHPSRC